MRAAVERAAMRRGCVWPIRPVHPEFEADLGSRRLAGAGLAADDDHLMVGDQFRDLGPPRIDRQVLVVLGFGSRARRASARSRSTSSPAP